MTGIKITIEGATQEQATLIDTVLRLFLSFMETTANTKPFDITTFEVKASP